MEKRMKKMFPEVICGKHQTIQKDGPKTCMIHSAWATCAGTTTENLEGVSFGSRKISNWPKAEPARTLAKNTVHIVNQRILLQALLSIPLTETNTCIVENSFVTEGTKEETSRRMTLGRYPVTSWLTTALQGPNKVTLN
jgi:hypothetical protein